MREAGNRGRTLTSPAFLGKLARYRLLGPEGGCGRIGKVLDTSLIGRNVVGIGDRLFLGSVDLLGSWPWCWFRGSRGGQRLWSHL